MNASNSNTCCSSSQLLSLGKELLPYCQPQDPNSKALTEDELPAAIQELSNASPSDLTDWETVRDAALERLSIALGTCFSEQEESMEMAIVTRIRMAMSFVKMRCISEDMLDDCSMAAIGDDGSHDTIEEDSNDWLPSKVHREDSDVHALSGFSIMPRAKRELCYQLLQSTLKGIQYDVQSTTQESSNNPSIQPVTDPTTAMAIRSFGKFCSSCLLGETDPR